MDQKVRIYLITGFLGSGKTTLIKNLLESLIKQNKRAGVIVNEFGQISVDGKILNKYGSETIELNNGSIFCQCMSETFVDEMISFAKKPIDLLFVETTGLADPSNMNGIMREVEKRTNGKFQFNGSICIVDANFFEKLSKKLATFNRQIQYSSLILLNKADLADKYRLADIEKKIRTINPSAEIIRTMYCDVPLERLNPPVQSGSILKQLTPGENFKKRIETIYISTNEDIPAIPLNRFINNAAKYSYRIKGFARTTCGDIKVDCVNEQVSIIKDTNTHTASELIIISKNQEQSILSDIKKAWENILGINSVIKSSK